MAGLLAQDRIDRLSRIGFKWALKQRDPSVTWETRFDELVQYKTKHGSYDVPRSKEQLGLGKWVDKQRYNYKKNKLSQDRLKRLSSIGFKWEQRGLTEKWETRFNELRRYNAKHGDCNVSRRQGKLGLWVMVQRKTYNADSLAQERIDRLSSIGFKWALKQASPNLPWATRLNELIKYKAKHGDCNVPQKQGQLGRWVSHQRSAYMANSLAQDRVDRLDSIGFKWALKQACPNGPWATQLNELIKYKAKHGDCNVPQRQRPLGSWVGTQRANYKNNKLSQDRIDRLNAIGFEWTASRGDCRKRKSLPRRSRRQSLSRKEKISLLRANETSLSVGDEASFVETNEIEGGDCDLGHVPPNHNHETESDSEEIGALIYEHVMARRKQVR